MAGLFVAASVPGQPSGEAAIVHEVFDWFPPAVYNILHIPAYTLLAWALYNCLHRFTPPRIGIALTVAAAGAYGALIEWYQLGVPGRYGSLTDITLNLVGACAGAWYASTPSRLAAVNR